MKVWGKEISSCDKCVYVRSSHGNGYGDFSATCLLKPEYIYKGCPNCWYDDTTSKIDKNCPFSKPITSEVVESYGFKFITNKYILPTYEKVCGNMTQCIYLGQGFNGSITTIFLRKGEEITTLFKGIINNPVELEFILKSTKVIE